VISYEEENIAWRILAVRNIEALMNNLWRSLIVRSMRGFDE
jgi:hypothetical protein